MVEGSTIRQASEKELEASRFYNTLGPIVGPTVAALDEMIPEEILTARGVLDILGEVGFPVSSEDIEDLPSYAKTLIDAVDIGQNLQIPDAPYLGEQQESIKDLLLGLDLIVAGGYLAPEVIKQVPRLVKRLRGAGSAVAAEAVAEVPIGVEALRSLPSGHKEEAVRDLVRTAESIGDTRLAGIEESAMTVGERTPSVGYEQRFFNEVLGPAREAENITRLPTTGTQKAVPSGC